MERMRPILPPEPIRRQPSDWQRAPKPADDRAFELPAPTSEGSEPVDERIESSSMHPSPPLIPRPSLRQPAASEAWRRAVEAGRQRPASPDVSGEDVA